MFGLKKKRAPRFYFALCGSKNMIAEPQRYGFPLVHSFTSKEDRDKFVFADCKDTEYQRVSISAEQSKKYIDSTAHERNLIRHTRVYK